MVTSVNASDPLVPQGSLIWRMKLCEKPSQAASLLRALLAHSAPEAKSDSSGNAPSLVVRRPKSAIL